MSDFGKELINTNVDIETIKKEIISKIIVIKSPEFNVSIEVDEIFKIIVTFGEKVETFEVFDITPEVLDVTIAKINEYVRGL